MLEVLFGKHAGTVMKMIDFVIGKPHKTMGMMYVLVIMNMIISMFQTKNVRVSLSESLEKAVAYTIFIILGNFLDNLVINELFNWTGSTQFLICLYLVAREMKMVKDYLSQRYGIEIPILNERIGQLENGQVNPTANWQDPNAKQSLDARIEALRQELKELEQQKQQEMTASSSEGSPSM